MQALKCIIIGDPEVGKTDLYLKFTTGSVAESYKPTIFDVFTKEVTVEDDTFNFGLWDSAGDSIYDEIRPICYPHTDCFVICYAINNKQSYYNVEKKWKPEMLRHGDGPSVPIVLVGLKADLREDKSDQCEVSKEEGIKLQHLIGATHFFEASSKLNNNVNDIFETAIKESVLKKLEEEKPPNPVWGFEDLKILMVGDSTVGKSSILKAYASKKPVRSVHEPTTEIVPHYVDLVLDGIEYFLGLYDIPSGSEFLQDRIAEYSSANGIILCYAVNDPFSFQNIEQQWLQEIKHYCPEVPFIIVGNKSDLKEVTNVLIPCADGEELMISSGASAFIECSAKTFDNLCEVFTSAAQNFKKDKSED